MKVSGVFESKNTAPEIEKSLTLKPAGKENTQEQCIQAPHSGGCFVLHRTLCSHAQTHICRNSMVTGWSPAWTGYVT